jgi:hypothetical protein
MQSGSKTLGAAADLLQRELASWQTSPALAIGASMLEHRKIAMLGF